MRFEKLSTADQLVQFQAACIGYWEHLRNRTVKTVNQQVRVMDKLAALWADKESLRANLCPLLRSEDERLRFSAAAYLVKYERDESAVDVLRKLVAESPTLVSTSAAALLRVHKIAAA